MHSMLRTYKNWLFLSLRDDILMSTLMTTAELNLRTSLSGSTIRTGCSYVLLQFKKIITNTVDEIASVY